jgi:cytoskeletal protein CcmA (bactofilin family)
MVFVPVQSAAASGAVFDGQIIFGQSYTLKSGETLNGDLVVFGGSATIEEGATVNGNLVLFGGNLSMNGEVTGDVAVTGGSVALGPQAHIGGNLATVGTSLSRADGSQVDGQIYNTATSLITEGSNGSLPQPPVVITPQPFVPVINLNFNPLWEVMKVFGQALGIAVLAMLLMLFLAPHADRVAHGVIAQPLVAGGLGLLTVVLAPVAILALVLLSLPLITLIITVPAGIILVVALGMAMLFGWIAIGYEIGQRLTRAFQWNWHPAFSAGLGVFLLTLVANGASILNFIPFVGLFTWILPSLIGLFALGAVIMTRFGTQGVAAPAVQTAVVPVKPSGKKSN